MKKTILTTLVIISTLTGTYAQKQINTKNTIINPYDNCDCQEWWDYQFKNISSVSYIEENRKANNGVYVQGWAGGAKNFYKELEHYKYRQPLIKL